jgi:hypothetical protein
VEIFEWIISQCWELRIGQKARVMERVLMSCVDSDSRVFQKGNDLIFSMRSFNARIRKIGVITELVKR